MAKLSLLQNNSEVRHKTQSRIDELAVLPVFFKLCDRQVVIIGGTDAAAWKAELLCKTGAKVHIYAPEISDTFMNLIAKDSSGRLFHHRMDWINCNLEGACLIIADATTASRAKQLYSAAKVLGIPINIIDRPQFCDFQFGSIVNRSPVVIGISTDGASPILGQAIRRKIETLLPKCLSDWTILARSVRKFILEKLSSPIERRQFWEKFVDLAFSESPGSGSENQLIRFAKNIPKNKNAKEGKVSLVGAGPGDPELLTLKAVRTLQTADVILYDSLVSESVLELARREAKRVLVGKRGGKESCKQEAINDLIIKLARSGAHVVRLKSGDPMIFGRAGEEISRLSSEKIRFNVIPGITAACAMASILGTSLTHRDIAQSVQFVTGHSRYGDLPGNINWESVVSPDTTTIFYMAGRTANKISEKFLQFGASGDLPVSICSSISQNDGRIWRGTIKSMCDGISEIGYQEPLLIGIGYVFEQKLQKQQDIQLSA